MSILVLIRLLSSINIVNLWTVGHRPLRLYRSIDVVRSVAVTATHYENKYCHYRNDTPKGVSKILKPITFPNLNLEFNINPVAFNLFGKDIYWYGVIIMLGIILAVYIAYTRLKKMPDVEKYSSKLSWDAFTDFLLVALPVGVIGARLYYCAFKWDYYGSHLTDIFKIWEGGLAIYGGIIGGVLVGIIFCKMKKIPIPEMGDFCMPLLALCQSIGRWGNFINREAHGTITDTFLKMGIYNNETNAYEYVHPTFLYESICTLIIFIVLSIIYKKRKFVGQVFYLYPILYGISRYFIEGLRTDSLYIGNTSIRVSQALSLVLVLIFSIIYIFRRNNIRAKLIKILRDNRNVE